MARFLALLPFRRPAASPHPARNSERGFTVLETLIATLVLSVGLVALAELMAVTLRMHQLGRNSTRATRLAQDKFEELMKMNFDLNPQIQINANNTLASNVTNYWDAPTAGFTRRWSVSAGPGANPRLRTVAVRIVPTINDRRTNDVIELTTVIRSW